MPIAILGTGRSGTSMITRMLNLCGLYMGDQDGLWDSFLNPDMNPTGYWEQREVHALMDRLFEQFGGTWENPPLLSTGWEYDPVVEPFYREARDMMARLFGNHENWAWKLPKATVVIAFWQRVIPDLKFIVCVRNPLDFAQSLGKYSPASRSHLFAMWQYYNYHILTATNPSDRIITYFEDFFPCYHVGLKPLLDFTGLPHPQANGSIDQSIRSFHNQSLKHYTSTLQDVLVDHTVPAVTKQLYQELLSGNASASDLPLLSQREMLLPHLRSILVGEGILDGSGAVCAAQHKESLHPFETAHVKRKWYQGLSITIRKKVSTG